MNTILKLALILYSMLIVGTINANPLVGENHYCSHEGARVKVSSALLDDSCLMCYCRNHVVQCKPTDCPAIEGCYRLQRKPNPECCQTCLGCRTNEGKEVSHGFSWQENCTVHQCQAGVLTTSENQCYVPCSSPLPPSPPNCCPSCKGCWLEGLLLPDGGTSSPRLDPCVKCECNFGKLTCTKRSCPVLSCPANKAIPDADGCCLICNGSRETYIPGGRCFLGKFLYQTGDNRTFDQCTTCSCHKGFLTCERQTCPPLQCPEQYRQTKIGHCCPECVYPTRSQVCINEGTLREHGEEWHLDLCSTCKCNEGQVTCQVEHCEFLNQDCPIGFKKEKNTGDCCPRCVEEPGVCVAFGDPHYRTFDSYLFNFQGECRYELARDCLDKEFSVRVNNDARRSSHFSWTRSLSLKIIIGKHKYRISLGQKFRTKVDKKRVKLPFEEHGLKMYRQGYSITVDTPIGLKVNWDGVSYVEVELQPRWRNRTCGLCGNFNNNMEDDKKSKNGDVTLSDEDMANSWQSGKVKSCSRRLNRLRNRSEKEMQIRTQRLTCLNSVSESSTRCAILNSTYFDNCRKRVSVENFYSSCLLDLCECPNPRMCECDAIVAFVRHCERVHFNVSEWRLITKCGGLECPYGSMFMECAPACKPSCKTPVPNPDCHMRRCKPGCYCPPPTVLHKGACILPENCPKKKTRSRKS